MLVGLMREGVTIYIYIYIHIYIYSTYICIHIYLLYREAGIHVGLGREMCVEMLETWTALNIMCMNPEQNMVRFRIQPQFLVV